MTAFRDLLPFAPLAVLTVAVVAVPMLIFQADGLPRLRAVRGELAVAKEENERLTRDVARLRGEVKGLREDPRAVERIARERLGMVRSSEVVFQFGSKPGSSDSSNARRDP